jgi:hypothetical protein
VVLDVSVVRSGKALLPVALAAFVPDLARIEPFQLTVTERTTIDPKAKA